MRKIHAIHKPTVIRIAYWSAAAMVGLLAVAYARFVTLAQNVYLSLYHAHPQLMFAATPLGFLVAAFLVVKIAPQASGSGIPQVLVAIEHAKDDNGNIWHSPLVSIKTAFIKTLSSIAGILGGASVGREGPTVQIASSVFAALGKLSLRWVPKMDFQTLLVGGGAAGVAAAFNTPLAGITFALEEITEGTFGPFKRVAMTSVVIAGVTAQALVGDYLYFGHPSVDKAGLSILPNALMLGIVGGIAGGLFAWALANPPRLLTKIPWWAKALVCGFACAGFAVMSLGDTAGSGYEITKRFMDSPSESLSMVFPFEKFATTVLSYYSGMAGGIFSPSLAIGAGFGATFAHLVDMPDVKVAALIGMVAFFSGAIQAPLTGVIIVMEMTDEHTLIIPFLVAAFLAQRIGQLFMKEPLYRHLAKKMMHPS